jgi:long-subunit fatty acid transport protein
MGQEESSYVSSEDVNTTTSFKDKLFTGGNFGFNISNGLMYVEISPMLGYKINDKLSAGISAKYLYWGGVGDNSPFRSFNYYGGGVFSRYSITESILATVEYELLNVEDLNPNSGGFGNRTLSNVLLVGAGYNSQIANNFNLQIYLLYDVIDDPNSPYRYNYLFGPNGIPVIYRIGFSLGF